MNMKPGILDLASTFLVVEPDLRAIPVEVNADIYERLDRDFDHFQDRLLVSCHSFDSDWPTWEIHPAGDETVILLSGQADMVLDRIGTQEVLPLSDTGTCIIVPRGTWHTARISQPTRMLFITPGAGTENQVR